MMQLFRCGHFPIDLTIYPQGYSMVPVIIMHSDVIVDAMASQITSLRIVCSTVYSGADQRKYHKVPRHWPFVRGIHRWPLNSPHKRTETRKMFPIDDVIVYPTESVVTSRVFKVPNLRFCPCWGYTALTTTHKFYYCIFTKTEDAQN